MGIRDAYDHGVFSWVDLATTDVDQARAFYSALFSWTIQDQVIEGGSPYFMAFKSDRPVTALFPMEDPMLSRGMPPHWQSYINVTDLETVTQRWQEHGGTVLGPVIEIPDAGSMATVQGVTGEIVQLWQAHGHIGAGVVNEINTFCWAELQTRQPEKAATFYQAVFDWQIERDDTPPHYRTCRVNGQLNCGIFDQNSADVPSTWAVYFNVEDLDATIRQVQTLGGTILMEPMVIEEGRFTMMADPLGAISTVIQLSVVDN